MTLPQRSDSIDGVFDQSNLTNSQLQVWLGQKLNPESPLYNMVLAFTIEGKIDPGAFQQAFHALTQQADALRTVIDEIDGVPQRKVVGQAPSGLEFLDFSAAPDIQGTLNAWIEQRRAFRFDLGSCLFDTALIKLADDRFVWYLNQHHLITDGWSVALLYRRMAEFYGLALQGQLAGVVPLPTFQAYADYEREYRHSTRVQKAKAYWAEKSAEPPEPLQFYGRMPSSNQPSMERVSCNLGRERTEKLQQIAMEKGIRSLTSDLSLFNIFATLFFTYLHRIGRAQQLAIGAPAHNRPSATFKATIGLFIELFPLQVDVAQDDTFLSLLKKVRTESNRFLRHAQPGTSTPKLHGAYNVVLNFINASFGDFHGLPMRSEWIHPGLGDSSHSLDLQVHDFDSTGSFHLHFDFACDVFEPELRRTAVDQFLAIVDAFIDDRTQPVAHINLLSDAERQRNIIAFNNTRAQYPQDLTVVQLFEQQVAETPDAVAVSCEGEVLSYHELNAKVNQLAHFLRTQGIGPGAMVGVCMERSIEMLIAVYGVLKAGGAYLPLDIAAPEERLAYILSEAGTVLVLTSEKWRSQFPASARTVCLDSSWTRIAQARECNLPPQAIPGDLAYTIYTSGSTGRPKGVMIEHRNLVNYIWWAKQQYLKGEVLDFPLYSPFAFDLTVTSIFVPLISGGQVVVYPEGDSAADLAILRVIEDDAVDVVKLTPSHLSVIREMGLRGTRMKRFIVGGEDLKTDLARAVADLFYGNIEIYNEYGPTEATVGCMIHRFDPQNDLDVSVPIGYPAHNARIYVLDEQLNPVPTGVVGEMVIAGDGLARGYLNRSDLTQDRFLIHPHRPDERVYRTGDLARWKPNGQIEFLGRADHQVKIRGARIELGEIEAALAAHPEIQECVVDVVQHEGTSEQPVQEENCVRCGSNSRPPAARTNGDGVCDFCLESIQRGAETMDCSRTQKRLVAYYIADELLIVSDLRSHLAQKLPDYMIPSYFVLLDAFPLTPNGKLARDALPAPAEHRENLRGDYLPPTTPQEGVLADIWSEVLRMEQIGIHDDFFDLGGDSILNIQIVARAKQAGLHLTPRQLFDHPTIAQLASLADTTPVVQAEQGAVTGPVPLTPIQQWFLEQDQLSRHHWNMVAALDLSLDLDLSLLEEALQHLPRHHDALRLRFTRTDAGWEQTGVAPDERVPLRAVDLSGLPPDTQDAEIASTETALHASIDLAEGPLMHVAHFRLGPNRPDRLLLIAHHLATDGVSWGILLEDLERVYHQLQRGESVVLPPKTTSFKRWAEYLTQYTESEAVQQELGAWLTASAVPGSPSSPDNTEASTATTTVRLSRGDTAALLEKVPSAYNTQVDDLLLTALVQSHSRLTGAPELLVDVESHGRAELASEIDLSRSVGWFTAIYPINLKLVSDSSPGDALKSVKEQHRRIPNRGIGYGLLRYLSDNTDVRRQLRERPQAEILFNYLGQWDRSLPDTALFGRTTLTLSRAPEGRRRHALEINAYVMAGELQVNWGYSRNIHQHDVIGRFAEHFLETVQALIRHCLSPEAGGHTPSDFPLAGLNQQKLDTLARLLGKVDG